MDDLDGRDGGLERASVVHDVNQMLAVIRGRVGLLLAREPDDALRAHLEAIDLACTDAGAMLERLQGWEAGAGSSLVLDGILSTLSLAGFRREPRGWSRLGDGAATGAWRIALDVPGDLVCGLPGQVLREALGNLVTNAVEAMPGTGVLEFRGEARGGRVILEVADGGPGIPGSLRDRLFQPGASSKAGSGRGLGLAGVRSLLERCGASLELGSTSGQGSVFVLDLPGGTAAPRDVGEPGAAVRKPGNPGQGAVVLVVDDEPAVRNMLADVLGELGCAVTCAVDANEALALFAAGRFQVALLDQNLPGMSGAALANRLRASDPCLAVFLMTGWGDDQAFAGPDLGPVDFTARKPLEFGKLRALLEEAAALHARRSHAQEPPDDEPRRPEE
ncbi:MAG: ATP-binding protein [Candidatus Krumholzibacteriia bacterium]